MKFQKLAVAGLAMMCWSGIGMAMEDDHMPTPQDTSPAAIKAEEAKETAAGQTGTVTPATRHHVKHHHVKHHHITAEEHKKWEEKWEKLSAEEKAKWEERHQKWKEMTREERLKFKAAHKKMMKHLDHKEALEKKAAETAGAPAAPAVETK